MTASFVRNVLVCVALAVAVLAVYWPVQQHEFVSFDDYEYVVNNPHVRPGLSADGLRWALTAAYRSNWHPLTWLSHMLDVELWGVDAGAHHRTNLLLHLLNALLLFATLHTMTRERWPSALVAALFAVHPLHVESVAWVAERKDVLSGTFWMLTLLAYARFVRRPGRLRYGLVAAALGLGLMAKQMLVTLPCVLLLLDVWPLRRWTPGEPGAGTWIARWLPPRRLVLEKLPLLGLALAAAPMAILSQKAGGSLYDVPLAARLVNAPLSYATYLWKAVWPAGLAVFYPHPADARGGIDALLIAGAATAIVAITAMTGVFAGVVRARPYWLVGWFWFLGALVPVLGIVQVGRQSMADRYTYLPLIGVYLALAWAARDLVAWRARLRAPLVIAAALMLVGLAATARAQVGHWRNSESLFRHSLEVTGPNPVAHNNLGAVLFERGNVNGAVGQYRQALAIDADFADAHANLGAVYAQKSGAAREAKDHLKRALEQQPNHTHANYTMGYLLEKYGQIDEAVEYYEKALASEPGHIGALTNLGVLHARRGELDAARTVFHRLLELRPDDAPTLLNLGRLAQAYDQQGRKEEARAVAREAVRRARAAGRDDVARRLEDSIGHLLRP